MAFINMVTKGTTELKLVMKRLERAANKPTELKKALKKASQPVIQKAQENLQPVTRSGHLAKSLGTKITIDKKDQGAHVVIGPKSKYEKEWNGEKVIPRRYAHLVEAKGKAQGWLRKAFESTKDNAIAEVTKMYRENLKKAGKI